MMSDWFIAWMERRHRWRFWNDFDGIGLYEVCLYALAYEGLGELGKGFLYCITPPIDFGYIRAYQDSLSHV